MPDILLDLSDERLSRAIEENLTAMIPILGKMGRTSTTEPPGVKRSIADVPFALFNSIVDARLAPEDVDRTIQFLIADSNARQVPLLWWIGPSTQPANLGGTLTRNGFRIVDNDPGMAVALENLNEDLRSPTGLSIELARDEDAWWEWSRTMALGFEFPPAATFAIDVWYKFLSLIDLDTVQPYLARLDGEAVATSLLFLGAGVAGIYSVATIPTARRKGVGALVTLHPLLQARARGFKAGVLEASEMGEGMYRALGFTKYCQICSYRIQA